MKYRQSTSCRFVPAVATLISLLLVSCNLLEKPHVGIGSDFDGTQATLSDLASVADLPNLTRELLRRGYSESDANEILGGNAAGDERG